MAGVEIRAATQADSDTVCRMVFSLLDAVDPGEYTLDMLRPATERVLREAADVFAFLALDEDRPVGVMVLNRSTAIFALGEFGEITELYVEPAHRSAGVGAALIEKAVAFGKSKGWSVLEVSAPELPKWQRSVDFYRRNGFEEIGPRLCFELYDV
jgi:GNAT superfamily N-acetyltransferase